MPEPVLVLKNISVYYGGVVALDGASVEVDEGEIVALMGPNGAGKSTILKTIFGLAEYNSGKVLWHNQEVKPVAHEMAERGIAFVPQGRRVFGSLTVEENLELGGFALGNKKELKRRVAEALSFFPELKRKRRALARTLSGGQQQMLAIGRALVADPKVLLLDEPTLGLAPKIVKEVFAKVKEINQRHRTAVLVVEHNITSLLQVADRAYVLSRGKVAAVGQAKDIADSGILEKVFLGK